MASIHEDSIAIETLASNVTESEKKAANAAAELVQFWHSPPS
jgi:hypothetical protein